MIKHIVFWRLKEHAEGRSKQENLVLMTEKLNELPLRINKIKNFEIGTNFNNSEAAYDIALYSEFEDKDSLERYLVHPAHQKVVEFISNIRNDRAIVDYEI